MLPLNKAITFDARAHRYTLGGTPLPSVSVWAAAFHNEPDMDAVAVKQVAVGKYAFPEDALGTWDWERARGTLVHAALENEAAELATAAFTDPVPLTATAAKMVDAGYDWLCRMIGAGWQIVGIEYRVAGRDYIGTVDLVLEHAVFGRWLFDWKTCRRLWLRAFVDDVTGELPTLRGPFAGIGDCKLTVYALKMAAYRAAMAHHGYPSDGAALVHLSPGGGVDVYATTRPRGLGWKVLPDLLPTLTEYLETLPAPAAPAMLA